MKRYSLLVWVPALSLATLVGGSARGEESAEDALVASYSSVADQTMTFTGREFATRFVARWAELDGRTKIDTVVVRERPAGTRGSLITVEYRFRPIYSGFFSPNRARLKEAAEAAAELAVRLVNEMDLARLLFKDDDLSGEEL
jgi:hypothetical protein